VRVDVAVVVLASCLFATTTVGLDAPRPRTDIDER